MMSLFAYKSMERFKVLVADFQLFTYYLLLLSAKHNLFIPNFLKIKLFAFRYYSISPTFFECLQLVK